MDRTDDIGGGYFQQTSVGRSPYAPPLTDDNFGQPPRVRRRVLLPVLLFLATCLTTYLTGGLAFAVPLRARQTTGRFPTPRRRHGAHEVLGPLAICQSTVLI